MALQSSGAISISQIKTELGSSSNSLRALSSAAGKSTPDAMSEFYGYSAAPPTVYFDSYHYGEAYGDSGQNDVQDIYIDFAGGLYNVPPYPWRGEYWAYDTVTDFYGTMELPEEGLLYSYMVTWNSNSSMYFTQNSGVPSGKTYVWTNSYYTGSADYFSMDAYSVSTLVRPNGSGLLSSLIWGEYYLQ